MDDFDDYIVDDIVFDDQTLAVLDQQEKQYFAEGSSSKSDEPANKRLKTTKGWSPAPVIQNTSIVEDDFLPEISLQGDGSYGLSAKLNLNPTHAYQARQGHPSPLKNAQITSANVQAPSSRMNNLSSLPYSASSRFAQQRSRQEASSSSRTIPASKQVDHGPTPPNPEGARLQKALEEINQLRADYARLQAKLQETQEVRIMKEGEVGVLRRSIEKTSQSHAAQLTQLKQEKEKAEARQGEMQKEIKEEIERLRTQFMFKQQEFEATIRKPPPTLRAKKISKELPATPVAFGSTQIGSFTRRLFPEATPIRPTRPNGASSPNKSKAISPQNPAKAGTLPGFHNAFDTSTPIRSQIRRINKGKEKQHDDVNMEESSFSNMKPLHLSPVAPRPFLLEEPPDELAPFSMPLTDNMVGTPLHVDSDEEVISEAPFEGINWKALMAHFLLTYSHPSSELFIFQRLLSTAQLINSALYIKCCSEIMEVIANPIDVSNFMESLKVVCSSLSTLYLLLNDANELQLLASVLNLTTKLNFAIPGFTSAISTSVARVEELDIMAILCKLILERLRPNDSHPDKNLLGLETILLLETLVTRISPENPERLKALPRNRECLMVLLHPSQPIWLLERASRLLCLLSYHHSIFNDILNISPPTAEEDKNLIKEPLIDLLCSHLTDSTKPVCQDNSNLCIYILTFFTQLLVSHANARAILILSHSLIPSIIIYLTQLTAPLWEDDETLINSPEETSSLIRTTNQATLLLHGLIFDGPNAIDLRSRLQTEHIRFCDGISHMFIATFGRLSFCDPPSWVNVEGKGVLEHICELSRDILEIVVDGPEVDNVWAAFQHLHDDECMTDEEDMEAKLLGSDDDVR